MKSFFCKFTLGYFLLAVLFICPAVSSQRKIPTPAQDSCYGVAYNKIVDMLEGRARPELKRAVFLIEWASREGRPDYRAYCDTIGAITQRLRNFIRINRLEEHPFGKHIALFEFFTRPCSLNGYTDYTFDFEHYLPGKDGLTCNQVLKLLKTHQGQCRSLPLLYKILAGEIGAQAYIAHAPWHSFIRHPDGDGGWINVELTNHSFPRESFIVESLDISQKALETGLYLRPRTDREILIDLLMDLSEYRWMQFGPDLFVKACTQTALHYAPDHLAALASQHDILDLELKRYRLELGQRGLAEDDTYRYFEGCRQEVQAKIEALGYPSDHRERYQDMLREIAAEKQRLDSLNAIQPQTISTH